jgi:guanine deaminase
MAMHSRSWSSPSLADGVIFGHLLFPASEHELTLIPDGAIVYVGGKIISFGAREEMMLSFPGLAEVTPPTKSGHAVIIPGLIDAHLHWVQNKVRNRKAGALLNWLDKVVYPEEAKFAFEDYSQISAVEFKDELYAVGTTAAAILSSIHPQPVVDILEELNRNVIAGNALATRNAPPELCLPEEEVLALAQQLAERFSRRYAITPRFAPALGFELMKSLAGVATRQSLFIQTHLAENEDEVKLVASLFGNKTYSQVYDECGLLGPRTLLAHCVHLSDTEWDLLKARDCIVIHCPTSNEFLGSGRMPVETVTAKSLRWALASDVGAGPSLSMLHVMKVFLEVHKKRAHVSAAQALYRATAAGAEALGLAATTGRIAVQCNADLTVLELPGFKPVSKGADYLLNAMLDHDQKDLEKLPVMTLVGGIPAYIKNEESEKEIKRAFKL